MVLSSLGGLNFYWKEEEAKEAIKENQLGMTDVEFPPTLSMTLDLIRRAEHAMGLDFFDGIIDIEVHRLHRLHRLHWLHRLHRLHRLHLRRHHRHRGSPPSLPPPSASSRSRDLF